MTSFWDEKKLSFSSTFLSKTVLCLKVFFSFLNEGFEFHLTCYSSQRCDLSFWDINGRFERLFVQKLTAFKRFLNEGLEFIALKRNLLQL